MPFNKEHKYRLVRYVTFLEKEIEDYGLFAEMTHEDYIQNRSKRRDVERWIENQINATVDIAKVILNAEDLPVPDTYREIVANLAILPAFKKETIDALSHWIRLRNIISHEYLDVKWDSIKKFILGGHVLYNDFSYAIKSYLIGKEKEMTSNSPPNSLIRDSH
jgi:uncharacterized protein YutE (UPF0331/DUF86 family)